MQKYEDERSSWKGGQLRFRHDALTISVAIILLTDVPIKLRRSVAMPAPAAAFLAFGAKSPRWQ